MDFLPLYMETADRPRSPLTDCTHGRDIFTTHPARHEWKMKPDHFPHPISALPQISRELTISEYLRL